MPYTKRPTGGTKIDRSNTTTADYLGPWTQIAGVAGDITLPSGTPSKIDITTHDDVITFGGFRQNGAGLADTTDLSFDMFFDPDDAQHQAMLADLSGKVARDYRITFPGGVSRKWGTRGQIGISAMAEINGYLKAKVTVLANTISFNVA
jgi:hypothetical protein